MLDDVAQHAQAVFESGGQHAQAVFESDCESNEVR